MKKASARGYLLEVVASKLIEVNGYELVTSRNDIDISNEKNGLCVIGRGGKHQFDSLGRFRVTPPFTYPLRLFVEAKYYSCGNEENNVKKGNKVRVGIDIIRMGIGILQDINTNYSTVNMSEEELCIEKYNYNYVVFSASGFTKDARLLAIAHKIYLVDLSTIEYRDIRKSIYEIVENINKTSKNSKDKEDIDKKDFNDFIEKFNKYISGENKVDFDDSEILKHVEKLRNSISGKSIYFASILGIPFVALFSENDKEFKKSLKADPHQIVSIKLYNKKDNTYIIKSNKFTSRVTFKLPIPLIDLVNVDENERDEISEKDSLGDISFIAYLDGENPTLCTMKFDKNLLK